MWFWMVWQNFKYFWPNLTRFDKFWPHLIKSDPLKWNQLIKSQYPSWRFSLKHISVLFWSEVQNQIQCHSSMTRIKYAICACNHFFSVPLLGGLAHALSLSLSLPFSLFFGNAGAQSGTGTSSSRVRRAHMVGRVTVTPLATRVCSVYNFTRIIDFSYCVC